MRIRTRFNIALGGVFILGFAVSALVTYRVLLTNAKDEVLRNAGMMMEAALAVRSYTIDEIKPHLDPMLDKVFLPQTVPAYSAIETFGRLQKKYPDFSYREATLNPTNPRDRSAEWETTIINSFRQGINTQPVHRPSDQDFQPGLPGLPQHPVGCAGFANREIWQCQRLWLAAQ